MKRVVLGVGLIFLALQTFAQYDPRPTRSRFYQSKYSTFSISPGDILLYSVEKDTQQYDLLITINDYGKEIDFDYNIPYYSIVGQMHMPAKAVTSGSSYKWIIDSITQHQESENMLWLSNTNYSDLKYQHATVLDAGEGKEIYGKLGTSTMKINFKGKEKIVTIYDVQNYSQGPEKSIAILTSDNNPLMIRIEAGYRITLKEVR